ncbi:hypothetical protein K439DRAFT_1622292 [Ramaria rubella]|nr:hypothetical protein K439DRAFT_1622292 [Ramaria rubella]
MILRVYALYLANRYVLIFLLSILFGQIIVSGWAVHFGIRVPQPPGFPGCVLTGSSNFFAALWAAPLVTDSCIFVLTLLRTLKYMRRHGRISTTQIILRDGTMYFFIVFSANLMNTLIYFLATEDLKAVGASFSQIITSIMISRLQLNLRRSNNMERYRTDTPKPPSSHRHYLPRETPLLKRETSEATGTFFTIGNLGEDLQGAFFDAPDPKNSDPRTSDDIELSSILQPI